MDMMATMMGTTLTDVCTNGISDAQAQAAFCDDPEDCDEEGMTADQMQSMCAGTCGSVGVGACGSGGDAPAGDDTADADPEPVADEEEAEEEETCEDAADCQVFKDQDTNSGGTGVLLDFFCQNGYYDADNNRTTAAEIQAMCPQMCGTGCAADATADASTPSNATDPDA